MPIRGNLQLSELRRKDGGGRTLTVNGDYENLNHYRSRDLLMIAHRAHNQAKCSESIAKWNLGVILTAEAVRSQMVVSIDYPVAET